MKMPGIYSNDPLAMTHRNYAIATSIAGKKTLEMMELFIGEIVNVKVVSVENKRLPDITYVGNQFDGEFSPIVYATIRKSDETLTRLIVRFMNYNGSWFGSAVWFPNYRAFSRIEFKPDKGDAANILKTHLGMSTDFRAAENKPGEFDIFGFDKNADIARANAAARVEELRVSLEKFNLGKYLKVVSPADKPEIPYMGENEPLFQPEKR